MINPTPHPNPKLRFSRPNGAWLFTADVTFIYISIKNRLGLTHRVKILIYGHQPLTQSAYRSFPAVCRSC